MLPPTSMPPLLAKAEPFWMRNGRRLFDVH
jgi:hypothetical protein